MTRMRWSEKLRETLRHYAQKWAEQERVPYYLSLGSAPTVLFERTPDGSLHGNFHSSSWRAMQANSKWKQRLLKPHTQRRALPEAKRGSAAELDSSNSSDALLMNCFCFPDTEQSLLRLIGATPGADQPEFGFSPRVTLADGQEDSTEIDMCIGGCFVEAKLTETDFTFRPLEHVDRYRHFRECFDTEALPLRGTNIGGYQLVRNVLAAAQHGVALVVLLDARRPDLLHEWWQVHSANRDGNLRRRCRFRTWQEVANASPRALASFLRAKYAL